MLVAEVENRKLSVTTDIERLRKCQTRCTSYVIFANLSCAWRIGSLSNIARKSCTRPSEVGLSRYESLHNDPLFIRRRWR